MLLNIRIIDTSIPWNKSSTKHQTIKELSNRINSFISKHYYGDSIETILIGLIVVEPIYDKFAKPRRPRYTAHKETIAFGSIPIVIHKTLEIEIKMNYEQVLAAEGDELRKMVATEVINNLRTLKIPTKVTDFEKDKFVADVESYFKSEHLID